MTELEFIDAIGAEVAAHDRATPRAFNLVEKGLEQFPESSRLWILKGDLIQVDESERYQLEDALESYRTAVRVEPDSAEAHESLGHYFNAVDDSPQEAERHFRKAVKLGSQSAHEGLAQVLEQLGKSE